MRLLARCAGLLGALAFAVSAHAQGAAGSTPAAAPAAPAASPSAATPAQGAAPGATGEAPAAGNAAAAREATGYAPSSIPSAVGRGGKVTRKTTTKTTKGKTATKPRSGSFVIQPGFESIDGGGSRVFVELGQQVPVEERKAKGAITLVLKGAHNPLRNNFNPLVTEHFNTPVRRARLVPAGRDLHFVIELRQDVAAAHHFVQSKEGHPVLQVDFGSGQFLSEPTKAVPEAQSERDAQEGDDKAAPRPTPAGKAPSKAAGKGPQP